MMKYIVLLLFCFILSSCFQASEPENFEKNSQNKVILALGDSLTEGYGVKTQESYPSLLQNILTEKGDNYTILNAGKSGDTSSDLLEKVPDSFEKNPEIVIIVIGGNDGLRKLPTTQMQENISKIISIYQEQGSKIVLAGVDISFLHGLAYRKEFLQVYENLSQNYPKIYFHESFLKGVIGRPALNIQDGIHPNLAGYTLIVSRMYAFLEAEKLLEK